MSMRALIGDQERLGQSLHVVNLGSELAEVPQTIVVRCGGRTVSINLDAIEWVEAAANYVKIHAGNEQYIVREKISSLEQQLPAEKFVRIHRSLIVSMPHVKELQGCGNGEFVVVLHTGRELPLGRTYRSHVEEAMKIDKSKAS